VDVTDSRFYDPPYGYRNLGMNAPFKSKTSPFRPTFESKYKGVFLNQGWPNWQPPYYSIKAISPQPITINGRTHNFYFLGWSASPQGSAEFRNANALETAVVFKQEGATVSANYKG